MAIFTFHFYKVFSTTQSLENSLFPIPKLGTSDQFLLSRQEVSESGKKQQRRLRCTKPRALIGIHGGGGYVVGGGGMAAMYSLVELDSAAAAGVTAATAATVFTHYCSSL